MDNFYVAFVYLLMIFLPCAFAEWGYIFTAEWWELRALQREQRRAKAEIPLNLAIATGFVSPSANRFASSSADASFAPVRRSRPTNVSPSTSMNSHESALRVAERLAALMEVHRLVANGLLDLPIDRAMSLAAESPLFADPVSDPSRFADPLVARPRTAAAKPPVTRTAVSAPLPAPVAPAARVARPAAPPVRQPAPAAPPIPAAAAPPVPRTAPIPQAPPVPQAMVQAAPQAIVQVAPQAFRTPIAAVPPRISPDMADVYALYGCDEILPPDPPPASPHESSGEISVAA